MNKKNGMGSHEATYGKNDEWLTPPEIMQALGPFDLDPCAPVVRPWPTAAHHFTIQDDGLVQPWTGRVWLNPPYRRDAIARWMKKMGDHGNGIALIFARTETDFFQQHIFPVCDSILFLRGRLTFYTVEGKRATMNAGAPSCLISYGEDNVARLHDSGLNGKHVPVNTIPMVIVGISPSWKSVVTIAMGRLNGTAHLKAIYNVVQIIAPDKTKKNPFFEEKIRQTLQKYFVRLQRGTYTTS